MSAPEVDWRDLFARYAAHVGEQEGVDFLDHWTVGSEYGPRLDQHERDAIDALFVEPAPRTVPCDPDRAAVERRNRDDYVGELLAERDVRLAEQRDRHQ